MESMFSPLHNTNDAIKYWQLQIESWECIMDTIFGENHITNKDRYYF